MTVDGKKVALVDAFAYSGERIDYDEAGNPHPHYNVVLVAQAFDRAALEASTEPVSDFNAWLYGDEPASVDVYLQPNLQIRYMQANVKGEYHAKPLRCHCDGAVSDVKLENGRLRGRIYAPKGMKSRHEGPDDPSGGRSLTIDVTIDVPVVKISG